MNDNSEKSKRNTTGSLVSPEASVIRFRKPLVNYLVSGLEENDKWVRIFAADMLGNAGDPRAVGCLKPLLVDRDQDIRAASARAMEMILSRQTDVPHSQPDRCESCMIRLIAEEALTKQKPGGQGRS